MLVGLYVLLLKRRRPYTKTAITTATTTRPAHPSITTVPVAYFDSDSFIAEFGSTEEMVEFTYISVSFKLSETVITVVGGAAVLVESMWSLLRFIGSNCSSSTR